MWSSNPGFPVLCPCWSTPLQVSSVWAGPPLAWGPLVLWPCMSSTICILFFPSRLTVSWVSDFLSNIVCIETHTHTHEHLVACEVLMFVCTKYSLGYIVSKVILITIATVCIGSIPHLVWSQIYTSLILLSYGIVCLTMLSCNSLNTLVKIILKSTKMWLTKTKSVLLSFIVTKSKLTRYVLCDYPHYNSNPI